MESTTITTTDKAEHGCVLCGSSKDLHISRTYKNGKIAALIFFCIDHKGLASAYDVHLDFRKYEKGAVNG